jgi:methyl-accepting chemotaxis protein
MRLLGTGITELVDEAGRFKTLFEAIQRGSSEQAESIQRVAEGQQRMEAAASEIARMARESAGSGRVLSEQVETLEELVASLKA